MQTMTDDLVPADEPVTNTGKDAGWPNTKNGMAWAQEFCARFGITDYDGEPINDGPGLMVSWFANAIVRTEIADPERAMRQARIEAATAARSVLVDTGLGSTKAPDVTEVLALASWILTGNDPYTPDPPIVTESADGTKTVWVDGHGMRVVEDTNLPDPI